MSYEQIQQPWDGRNWPWGRYKPASSTVMVSGCGGRSKPEISERRGMQIAYQAATPISQIKLSKIVSNLHVCIVKSACPSSASTGPWLFFLCLHA
eukprot:scaffold149460_cov69-Cyclotella_meneghiniana.AAC.2